MNTFKEIKDTTISNIPNYYVGVRKVSQSEYAKSDGYEYRLHDNSLVAKSMYDSYKKSRLYKLPAPIKVDKRIEYKKDVSVKSYEVRESSIEKVCYEVEYKYCVIFDASSGRVTVSEYFPFYVRGLHSEIIKEDGYN